MDRSSLTVRVLGSLTVHRDGALVGPAESMVKPRMLLATLAVDANRSVGKNALVARLWESPPPTARNLVEKYVSLWRTTLDAGRLETIGSGYRLNLGPDECDLHTATDLLERGRSATKQGDHAAAAAILGGALDLWDARFEDAAVDTLPRTDAERLTELRLTTVEEWAAATLLGGRDDPRVVDLLSDSHRRHPLRERLGELLIWALVRHGRQQDAIGCFERIRHELVEQLGQDPGEALQTMYLRVLRQDPSLLGAKARAARIDNLPPRHPRFVGRAEELAGIERRLTELSGAAPRAVAAWGLVGTGKSALALEYAHRNHDAYECIWWVDATTNASTEAGLESLAGRLGCLLPADREPSLHQLWDRMRPIPATLLILDNAASATDLVDCLPPISNCDVLITSMNPEWRRIAEPLPVGVMSADDSIRMLHDRIGAGDAKAEAVLVGVLGRLPLAMTQAAAFIDQTGMTVGEYLPLFRRRQGQLLQRGIPDDHRNTIDTIWRLARAELSASHPAAVQLLEICSFFASENIQLEMLTAVAPLLPAELGSAVGDELEMEELIRQVRRYSLIGRQGGSLQMHCLLQGVVCDSLSSVERDAWQRIVTAALLAAAPDLADWMADRPVWEGIVPHLRAVAGQWRGTSPADDDFIDLVRRGSAYLASRGALDDALELMQHAQLLTEVRYQQADHVAVGRGLVQLGVALEQSGHLAEALTAQESALAILRRNAEPDDPWTARALSGLNSVLTCHLGVSLWKASELAEAEERFVRVLDTIITTWGEDSVIAARTLAGLGQVRQDRGDLSGARECLERALRIIESTYGPDHPDVGHYYDKFAYLLALRGESERSRECYQRAAAVLSAAYHPEHIWVAWSLSNFAMLLYSTGDLEGAMRAQLRADRIFGAQDQPGPATQISAWRLSKIHLKAGRTAAAVALLEPAAAAAEALLGQGHADVVAMRLDLELAAGVRQ